MYKVLRLLFLAYGGVNAAQIMVNGEVVQLTPERTIINITHEEGRQNLLEVHVEGQLVTHCRVPIDVEDQEHLRISYAALLAKAQQDTYRVVSSNEPISKEQMKTYQKLRVLQPYESSELKIAHSERFRYENVTLRASEKVILEGPEGALQAVFDAPECTLVCAGTTSLIKSVTILFENNPSIPRIIIGNVNFIEGTLAGSSEEFPSFSVVGARAIGIEYNL